MVAIVNNHQFISANSQNKVTPAGKQHAGGDQHPSVSNLSQTPAPAKDLVQISAEARFVAAVAEFEKSIMNLRKQERVNTKGRNAGRDGRSPESVDCDDTRAQEGQSAMAPLEEIGGKLKAALRRVLDELGDTARDNGQLKERIAELRHRLKLDNEALSGLVQAGVIKPAGQGYSLDVGALQQLIAPVLRAAKPE